jgi:hypothetical protein
MANKEFEIDFTFDAFKQLKELKNDPSKKGIAKSVVKSISFMAQNLRHPSFRTFHINKII